MEYADQLATALAEGRRGDAVAFFMRLAGSSEEEIAGARESQWWPCLEELAHTLAYDAACLGDGTPPATRLVVEGQGHVVEPKSYAAVLEQFFAS